MPLVRVEVRNEYGLGMPELYTETNREDPKAVLDGVAVAGLVGILRQLGDLAEVTKQPPQNIFPPCFVDATTNRINSLLYKVRSIIHLRALKSLYDQWLRNSHLSLYSTLSLMSGVYMHSLPSLKKRADAIGDVAAGALIVKEAGGLIFDPSGNDFDITAQRIAASNPLMVMNWTRKVGYTRKLPHNHIQATSTTILSCGP